MLLATMVQIAVSLCVLGELYSRYKARRLPPGVVGFRWIIQVPRKHAWEALLKISQRYGDIATASVFGKHVIIINSAKIARELLEMRGTKHCDRPRSVMGGELSGWGKTMMLTNYTAEFLQQRKWFSQEIGSNATISNLQEMIESECRRTLRCVLEKPEKVQSHLRKGFTSMMSRLTYGYVSQDGDLEDDPLTKLGALATAVFTESTSVGRHFVDICNLLKYIPSWFPGGGFKKKAEHFSAVAQLALDVPHQFVVSQMAAGTALPSFSSRLLLGGTSNHGEESEEAIKWAASSLFRGGLDASTSSCYGLVLAMTLYPDVMKKAQQEIDSVVGGGRLPGFEDRPSLPYCECVFAELLRWNSAASLTLRRATADDEYNGYLIPKGTVIIINLWGMLRDERVYKEPLRFNPDRFVGEDAEPLPYAICFGFGRRRCPGNFLARATTWLMCVQLLAVFNISKQVENGVEITPEFKQFGMTILFQAPFKCSIKPRSKEAERVIRDGLSA